MNLIDWYVKKYWGKEYIKKTEIASQLAKAKEKEAEKWKAILEEEKNYALEVQEEKLRMEMAELEAECISLQRKIKDMKDMKKTVEREALENKKNSRKNLIVASEIKNIVNKLLNNVGEVQGLFDVVTRTAKKQVEYLDAGKIPSGEEKINEKEILQNN